MNHPNDRLYRAVLKLHHYLESTHWNGQVLVGPDSGVRWNFRLGRFVKSYLSHIRWADSYIFMQTQAYWIMANWLLADLTLAPDYQALAMKTTTYLVSTQQSDGHWVYPPLSSRVGKIATVEGNLAAIGLLTTYRYTRQPQLLAAARHWHHFLLQAIGFLQSNNLVAVNYWADGKNGMVPNNTTLTLWLLAELAAATGEHLYLEPCAAMIDFLAQVQMKSGELPYEVGPMLTSSRPHFLCYQYNAFEFLDLSHYYQLTGDGAVLPILCKLAGFLATGITPAGAARYNCHQATPEAPYYTAAVAQALQQATQLELGDFQEKAQLAYDRVLALQKQDGGLAFFSKGNYGLLTDRRSYPRNLSMILYHLASALQSQPIQA